ncbi:MAG: hypothetical protein IKK91_04900 [Ruminococcus sp.]|nr:hypothetical protein [Ruminococcus sp.]MBR6623221.1 hypothetical protein [Ruminococcus sp.]
MHQNIINTPIKGSLAYQPIQSDINNTDLTCIKQTEIIQTNSKGVDFMKTDSAAALARKKQTLIAWTKILLNEGEIERSKYNRMVTLIEKLTA